MQPEFVTASHIAERLGLSRASIRRLSKVDPDFPKPVKIGPRTLRWRSSDIEEYLGRQLERRAVTA